ncbi:acyltransferase family protein [Cognatilysobacter terrigena]|uniref:acyltransferase family protein n=1 Tax=Cognatilysobacter terrigena TaxID=2488749 RepID=UPI00105BD09E|nr:acyltransferase [Lysobacter terrigena]
MGVAASTLEKSRLHFLDAARGLAAAYVVLYHMVLIPEPDLAMPRWASLVVGNGGMGVTLFFIVSAFSLCYTMPARRREPAPWVSFFVHRFFRIAPLFYVWIALTLYRDMKLFNASHSPVEIALSASFLFNLVPNMQGGFVWASWTIGIEMVFYAMFPVFLAFAKNRSQAAAFAIALLLGWWALRGLAPYWPLAMDARDSILQWSVLRHLPVFACGVVAYYVFMDAASDSGLLDRGRLLLVAGLAVIAALLNGWLPDIYGDLYYWQAVGFTFVLLGLAYCPARIFVNRITRYLGRISYSLYLNHPTIVLLLAPIYASLFRQVPNATLAFLACIVVTFMVTIVAAELTFRLVEQPGINLGKRVNRSIQNAILDRQRDDESRQRTTSLPNVSEKP